MGKSTRLRLCDVEDCFELVEQCRELWCDPQAWRQHLIRGICRLTGQAIGHYAELDPALLVGGPLQSWVMANCGWRDEAARSHFLRWTADMDDGCGIRFPGEEKLFAELTATGRAVAFRPRICSDSDKSMSTLLAEIPRPSSGDGFVISLIHNRSTGRCSRLGVHQDPLDSAPTLRDKRLVELVHRRVAPLIDNVLAGEDHRSRRGLTARLSQTLDRLLAGDSEKEIVKRLGIRLSTVHEYVGRLYRHFNVNSRPELMAYFIRRRPDAG